MEGLVDRETTTTHQNGEDAAALRAFVAERDAPCPACGHNLRGLTRDVCPECREPLALRVGVIEQKMGALLTALAGLLAGAGTGVVVLGIIGYATLRFGGGPTWKEIGWFLVVVVLGVVVETSVAVWLCSRRRGRAWFRQKRLEERVLMAVGAWALTIGLVVLAIAVVN